MGLTTQLPVTQPQGEGDTCAVPSLAHTVPLTPAETPELGCGDQSSDFTLAPVSLLLLDVSSSPFPHLLSPFPSPSFRSLPSQLGHPVAQQGMVLSASLSIPVPMSCSLSLCVCSLISRVLGGGGCDRTWHGGGSLPVAVPPPFPTLLGGQQTPH